MAKSLDKASRILYRTLLKSAKTFDKHPACKALVCRDLGTPLPDPLDKYVARFLGGESHRFFWPTLEPQSVVESVRDAFRQPLAAPTPDDSFQALRYLTGVLSIAQKHGMLESIPEEKEISRSSKQKDEEQDLPSVVTGRILPAPEQGAVLIAHPCMPSWFSRTIVLLCQHKDGAGTHGICLNMPSEKPAGHIVTAVEEVADEWQEGGQRGRSSSSTTSSNSTADIPSFFLDSLDSINYEDSDGEELEARLIEVLNSAHRGETAVLEIEDEETAMAVASALSDADQFLETFVVASSSETPHSIFGSGVSFNSGRGDTTSGSRLCSSSTQSASFLESTENWLTRTFGSNSSSGSSSTSNYDFDFEGGAKKKQRSGVSTRSKKYNVITPKGRDNNVHGEGYTDASTGGLTSGTDSDNDSETDNENEGGEEGAEVHEDNTSISESEVVVNTKQLMLALPNSIVYFGGPVRSVNVLHGLKELGGELVVPAKENGRSETTTHKVNEEGVDKERHSICDAYLGIDASGDEVIKAIQQPEAAQKIRLFLGDSRWVAGQLAAELESGSWLLCKIDAATLDVFGDSYVPVSGHGPEEVQSAQWQRMLCAMGSRYAELAKIPPGVYDDLMQLRI